MSTPPPLPPQKPDDYSATQAQNTSIADSKPKGLGAGLIIGMLSVALVTFVILLTSPIPPRIGYSETYKTGYMIGRLAAGLVFFPGIIVGIFCIFRKFRNARSIALILMVVWGLSMLSGLGNWGRYPTIPTGWDPISNPIPDPASFLESFEDDIQNTLSSNAVTDADLSSQTIDPEPSIDATTIPDFDFSPGSDERFIEMIENAQNDQFTDIVEGYQAACSVQPDNAQLAVERVNFLERFMWAEDIYFADAEDEYEKAKAFLYDNFPNEPEKILHELNRLYGEEFTEVANRYAHLNYSWSKEHRGQFFLLRASQADTNADYEKAKSYARTSFDEHPTSESAMLLAESLNLLDDPEGSLEILSEPVFESANTWIKRRQLELLFELNQTERATAVFNELKESEGELYWTEDNALTFAEGGNVDLAREVFDSIQINDWNRENVLDARLKVELNHGDQTQAIEAYQALRELGIHTDPLFRKKLSLLQKYPLAGFGFQDILSLGLFVILFASLWLTPLVILLPIHYWSLLREKKGKTGGLPDYPLNLYHAWISISAMVCLDILATWYFNYEVLEIWWTDTYLDDSFGINALPASQAFVWLTLCALLATILWRTNCWRILNSGIWPMGKSIGIAFGSWVVLRIGLSIYVILFPGSVANEFASGSPLTDELSRQLLEVLGPFGLIAAIGILGPVVEEVLFRGILLHALARHIPFGWANVLQAVLFAAIHENYLLAPFFIAFGMVAGEMTRRSKGLLAAIIFHIINNVVVCLGEIAVYYNNQ